MVAWKMTLVSKGAIFHFHGYGRKGRGSMNNLQLGQYNMPSRSGALFFQDFMGYDP